MVLLLPSEIFVADDGNVTIDASQEASLQMNSTPDNPTTASYRHGVALAEQHDRAAGRAIHQLAASSSRRCRSSRRRLRRISREGPS
jgi:hypothetical protein